MLKHFEAVFAWVVTFALLMFVCAALFRSMELVVIGIGAVVAICFYGLIGIAVDSVRRDF